MNMSTYQIPHTIKINPMRKSLSYLSKSSNLKKDTHPIMIEDPSELESIVMGRAGKESKGIHLLYNPSITDTESIKNNNKSKGQREGV